MAILRCRLLLWYIELQWKNKKKGNSMKQNIISVQNLKKDYGDVVALNNVNFTVQAGEIFGFLGPSGAGKTTTVKILTKQLGKYSGEVKLFEKSLSKFGVELYDKIGIMTDTSGLYERLTVLDNLIPFAMIHKKEKRECIQVLKKVGLEAVERKKVSELSKGMKQRVILARAMLHRPDILFLDEPTSGLDPATAQMIYSVLKELKQTGTAIFLTTHNMNEAATLCDRLALLFNGQIVELGSPKEICLKYNNTKKYRVMDIFGNTYIFTDKEADRKRMAELFNRQAIETIHSCEPTLEQVFIEITGRGINWWIK